MKIQRFLVEKIEFNKDNPREVVLNGKVNRDLVHQILNVFRFKTGSQFVLFDGSGLEFLVEMTVPEKREVVCEIKEERQGLKRGKKLRLCFSMIKKENMELVLNMCTQLGVTHFTPFISERTVKTGWNVERMQKIVSEAVEQSGFADLPVVDIEPLRLPKLLEKFKKERENLDGLCVLDFSGTPLSSVKHLISVDTIFIGPEGGFNEKELELFKKYNIKTISLGTSTLRAETAAVATSSIFLL
jgi:16S rRNA (uracil1498-N3)-methyltransferase